MEFLPTQKIDTRPTLADFKKTVADYLAWEASQTTQNDNIDFYYMQTFIRTIQNIKDLVQYTKRELCAYQIAINHSA